ncbi:hypothetical protein SNE26_24565 [Mucilaginibacter sp. cycad4]|uniref:hypothetical protein n=1 Tax=Mucilaginibacter sp. cycad4 TaxID=3342096 RepID=UPI002AAA9FE5|nr:hypothetical protein [Mucilaginibacter gossypii]WPU99190.1 hypothetical protein SNE26_24565 [Mucilaginibacter gossypii]
MDYIKKRAEKFVSHYIEHQVDEHEKVINEAQSELYNINSPLDKITFLRVILEANDKEYRKHILVCTNKDECQVNYEHESIHYYLAKELDDLGIRINEDQFTREEQIAAEAKLDQVLQELEKIKMGQQIIYDDLSAELQELKDFYILGKKKWYQLFLGKTTEMVISGVISETVSKELISAMGDIGRKLLL